MISFHPFGGAQEVGASCGILKLGMRHILVDAGMRPAARPGQSRTPDLEALKGFPLDAILITHAHIDHTGCLPLVASLFPTVPIYATESTIALMRILLLDSARIMEQEHLAHELETSLYDQAMVVETLARIIPVAFHQELRPVAANQEIAVTYLPAGHILGAGMLHLTSPWGSILHTGDISVGHHRTITGVDLNTLPQVDMMIIDVTELEKNPSLLKELNEIKDLNIKKEWNSIVKKCMDLNPDHRYPSVKELIDDVDSNLKKYFNTSTNTIPPSNITESLSLKPIKNKRYFRKYFLFW
ncbi:MBL fold metallo-hydrolase [Herpetosiphon geysericola]|uniref:Metallo-beta-lactamase domain-containing protein n=1 Tax=Herpetosiphon geysericola TaxID=70996 RepID=A0A0P6Y1L8_9CHLR|nr:MBL fold metallo-hydrolase [Herpetosiphon geysericola]KPL91492.1 hypothetical protein SE18_02265 [Herpetosiphon geysericola]